MSLNLTETVALGGLISGVAGLVLGIMNFRRDRAQVDVFLQWDMSVTPGSGYDHNKKWTIIRVQNAGRRAAFVSHVSIRVPKGYDHTHVVAMDSVTGEQLSEGDAPKIYLIAQDGFERYAKVWRKLRAEVSDSAGRIWKSPRLAKSKRPSWANPIH
jgi:hypothetical protein